MSDCPLFRIHRRTLRGDEITGSQQASVTVVTVPYCDHKHSPMPRSSIGTFGASTRLQCGGDLERCQVPLDKR